VEHNSVAEKCYIVTPCCIGIGNN